GLGARRQGRCLSRGLGLPAHAKQRGNEAASGVGIQLRQGADAKRAQLADDFVEGPQLRLEVPLAEGLLDVGQLDDDAMAAAGGGVLVPSALAARTAVTAAFTAAARTSSRTLWNL